MSLGQAMTTALDGLRVTQSGMTLIASNVANSETPGYTEKVQSIQTVTAGGSSVGVDVAGVTRQLNSLLQSQLRTETTGASSADLTTQIYQQLQQAFGDPSSSSSLNATYSAFSGAVQTLASSPADYSAQSSVLQTGQALAGQLNSISTTIQQLRSGAEQGIDSAVTNANNLIQGIAQINSQVAASPTPDATTASLLDQRDQDITQLAQLMDIRVVPGNNNQVTVLTSSGLQLAGTTASTLSFDTHGTIDADSTWSADPSQSGVGTITLTTPDGSKTDMIAANAIRSGQIGAYLKMRDTVLPQAQAQLDQIAASVSSALSDQQISGTAVSSGTQSGFSIDVGSLSAGNSVTINYSAAPGSAPKTLTIKDVTDPSSLPLPSTDPNNPVIGVDFSGGMAAAISQLNGIFQNKLGFSNPSGTTLQVLNGGPSTGITINSVTANQTQTSLSGGTAQLPFFTDGSRPYTGAVAGGVSQTQGYAGRITVNPALLANPSALVSYQSGTQSGDPTRPNFIASQLSSANFSYSPQAGIGTAASPFNGTLSSYINQVLSTQGAAASSAQSLSDAQDVVLNTLQQSYNSTSGINIDTEMSNLISLQNAYSANARVLTTVNAMFTTLYQAISS